MAISVTVTATKIDVTATDAGGNTIDEIYQAVAASGFPANMTRAGAGPYTYSIPAQTELEISTNCYIKDYSVGGGILQWSSRSANSTNLLDLQNNAILELGPDWLIDFDTSDTYYVYVHFQGQSVFQGTSGHDVVLQHYFILYIYALEGNSPTNWNYVTLQYLSYGNGYFLYFISSLECEIKPEHVFNNITFKDVGDATARGYILFIGTDNFSRCTFSNLTFDGTYRGIESYGSCSKFSNCIFKNMWSNPILVYGSGVNPYYEHVSDASNKNKNIMQQPKITFENCTFQDNYGSNKPNYYASGLLYAGTIKYKNCTFQGTGGNTCLFGTLSHYGGSCLYEGTTTFNSVTNNFYWGTNGSHFDVKTLTMNVVDQDGIAIENVIVNIREADDKTGVGDTFITNALGQVLDLFGDNPVFVYREITSNAPAYTNWTASYEVKATKSGYESYQGTIDMTSDQTATVVLKDLATGGDSYLQYVDSKIKVVKGGTLMREYV